MFQNQKRTAQVSARPIEHKSYFIFILKPNIYFYLLEKFFSLSFSISISQNLISFTIFSKLSHFMVTQFNSFTTVKNVGLSTLRCFIFNKSIQDMTQSMNTKSYKSWYIGYVLVNMDHKFRHQKTILKGKNQFGQQRIINLSH